jgi:thioredoxin family protein
MTCTSCWGGTGTIDVFIDGRHTQTIDVRGVPRLYTLFRFPAATTRRLRLRVSPGIRAYDFTFG